MKPPALGVCVETLTPFCYHSLMVQGGSATLPVLIGDQALDFALANALGWMRPSVVLPDKDYKRDLDVMPWRFSVMMTETPRLLPPLVRRLNLDAEAGFPWKIQDVAKRGNLKDFFQTQEVPPGQFFRGAIFGFDPFEETGRRELVLRIGLHRNGMIRLTRDDGVKKVRLNAATALLFGRRLPVERFFLYGIQLTPEMELDEAAKEVAQWR